jgi:hypothetical protein
MSRVYQPPGQPFDPLYIDGLENAVMRNESGVSTSGTGVDPLFTVPIVAGALNLGAKTLKVHAYGGINNAAGGNKRILVNFDAAPLPVSLLFDTGLAAFNSSSLELYIMIMRRFDQFVQTRVWLEHNVLTGTSAAVTKIARSDVLSLIDFNIAHTINVFGEVSNAADTVTIDAFRASMI